MYRGYYEHVRTKIHDAKWQLDWNEYGAKSQYSNFIDIHHT